MDKIKFARLVSWITAWTEKPLSTYDLNALDEMVQSDPPVGMVRAQQVLDLLDHMAAGRKMDACIELRRMTDIGITKSKNTIESAMGR